MCCTQYASTFGKLKWPQNWKWSVAIPIPKKGNAKECSNYHTIALISHTSKSWLKTQISKKQRSWHPVPTLHGKQMRKFLKKLQTLFPWALKSLQMVTAAMELKETCSLEEKLWQTKTAQYEAETLLYICQQRSILSKLWIFQYSCMGNCRTIKKAEH